jgi:type IV secretion system protein VirD4
MAEFRVRQELSFGAELNPQMGKTQRCVAYDLYPHIICFGLTRFGKGVALEIPNLLRLKGLSVISIDPKGQNAAVTASRRRKLSDVLILNPLNLLGLGSAGFNPLAALDPTSSRFFLHASVIAEALIKIEGKDSFFDMSTRNLILALIMWEVTTAHTEGRRPLLKNVRGMLTRDLLATAKKIFDSGNFQMARLAGQFIGKNRANDSIVNSAASQTQWLLHQSMLDDLEKDGIDFGRLKGPHPVTVYVVLPAHAPETFSVWLRLVVACAFNALYRHEGGGRLRTLFLLSEFAQLGKLNMVSSALPQGAGYDIQLFPVFQDINQLRAIYDMDEANTFPDMSGATFAFTPNDPETAEWIWKRSGDVTESDLSASDDPQTGARKSGRGVYPQCRPREIAEAFA